MALGTFGELLIVFEHKGRFSIPPLFNGLELLSAALDKAKLFANNFSSNYNLDESGISLPVLLSRTNLKLHIISVAPKLINKIIADLDLSQASDLDGIPVVALKNCESELSYILGDSSICVRRNLVFQIAGRSHRWSLYLLRVFGKSVWLKNTALLAFFQKQSSRGVLIWSYFFLSVLKRDATTHQKHKNCNYSVKNENFGKKF